MSLKGRVPRRGELRKVGRFMSLMYSGSIDGISGLEIGGRSGDGVIQVETGDDARRLDFNIMIHEGTSNTVESDDT